ncbi:MAG: hypothetical protein M1268_03480 [Patescibacteria group bacterium]|nr:hypothetical protein [Patescibacteria group bacterium]
MTQDKDMAHPITERETQETGLSEEQLEKFRSVAHGTGSFSDKDVEEIQVENKLFQSQKPEIPQTIIPTPNEKSGSRKIKLAMGGSALGLIGLRVAGCAPDATITPTAIVRPADTSTPTPELQKYTPTVPKATATKPAEPTIAPTVEATPTAEIKNYPGIEITEEFLKRLANMGGGEVPLVDDQETKTKPDSAQPESLSPIGYAQEAWPREDFSGNFTEDPVKVLEFLASETSKVGADGETVNFSVYPNFSENGDPLRVKRFKVNELPDGAPELPLNPAEENSPVIKKGADVIELGVEEQVSENGKKREAVIAITKYPKGGVPEHNLEVVPVEEQEGEKASVSLEELEQMAGSSLKVEGQDVVVDLKPKNGTKRRWKLNTIASSLFTKIKEKIVKQNAPELSPVEQAIKNGKIELKTKQDWEKYFKVVTPEEAERLLAEANKEVTDVKDYKIILPFRSTKELTISDFKFTIGDYEYNLLGIDNIPPGTTLYSPISGTLKLTRGGINNDATVGWNVKNTQVGIGGSFLAEKNEPLIPLGKPIEVKIGDPILTINNQEIISSYGHQANFDIVFSNNLYAYGSIVNLLVDKDTKKFIIVGK